MKTFSWRYRSWIGIEGTWSSETREAEVKVVLLGMLIGIDVGVAVRAPGGA